jgi:predicted acetyltransferase
MTVEIRTITADEIAPAQMISYQAFANSERFRPEQGIEQAKRWFQPDWHLAAFEDGEMVSMMRMLPFAMRLNGRGLPFAAISPVANSPLHRRKGHTGAMLRQSLALMRERGQWLSGLHTPHPAFYRRYGWEIASDERLYTFKPKDYRPAVTPSERGRLRWITPNEWHDLDRIYRRHSVDRNGPLHRIEVWWREGILQASASPPGAPNEAVIWEDGAAEPQGYVVFAMPNQGPEADKVIAREMAALTPDAYLNLLQFLAQHDIHSEIRIFASSEDPLPLVFADPDRLGIRQQYSVLLRIVDVEAALRSRPLAAVDVEAEFTLGVSDASAPWNEGVYRLLAAEGSVQVERVDSPPDLALDARVLAPVYNGYLKPSTAAATGQMRVERPEALRAADAFFSVLHRPYFPEGF